MAVVLMVSQVRGEEVWPGQRWKMREPEELGMSKQKLEAMAVLAGGRGCVVKGGAMVFTWGDQSKSGDVASAMKPVITTLMLMAVEEGRIKSVEDRVTVFEPRLVGKNEGITWRQLASQMSGYGLAERPGEAYSYNDFALALYYDTLMEKVYREKGTEVLKKKLGDVLGFEDRYTFEVFGPGDRKGRLGIFGQGFCAVWFDGSPRRTVERQASGEQRLDPHGDFLADFGADAADKRERNADDRRAEKHRGDTEYHQRGAGVVQL